MAILAPVFAAISTFAASSVIAGALVQFGAGLLLSAASRALMPKPEQNLTPRTFSTRNPVTPRDMVYGNVRKGGAVVFLETDDERDTDYGLNMIVVFAGHRVKQIGNIYFDGELASPGSDFATPLVGRWENTGFVQRHLGDDDQPASEFIKSIIPNWSDSHRLRGCAYVYVRTVYNTEDPQGIPNVSADILGKDDIYDPRSGTRGYSTNPALCLADYMSWSKPRGGLGIPYGDGGIVTADLIEAANICGEFVATPGGGTEPRYTCNGVLTLGETTPQDRIRAMLTAMAGSVTDTVPYRIRAGAYRTPTLSFGLDDLRGGIDVQALATGAEICNGTRGIFISPENDWQPDDFPAVQSAVYLAEDEGVETWHDINLPFTLSAGMAQRLAKIDLERTRRQITVGLTGSARWLAAQPGDVINLTIDRYGWSSKPFEIQRMKPRFEGNGIVVDVVLRETSPLVFSWNASEAQIYAAAPKTNLPKPWDIPAPGFISVTESLYITRDGAGVKARADLSWVAAPSAYVAEYRVRAVPPGGAWRDVGTTRGTTLEVLDVAPGIWQFEVRAVASFGSVGPAVTRTVELLGLSAPPAALASVSLQTAGGLAILRWGQVSELDVRQGGRIAIRHSHLTSGATWAASRAIESEPGNATLAVLPLMPGTYLLRAEDSSGIGGPIASASTDGVQAVAFSAVGSLQEGDEFSGDKERVYLTTLGATPGLILGDTAEFDDVPDVDALASWDWVDRTVEVSGTYDFDAGLDLLSVKRVRLRSEIAMEAYNPFDEFDTRLGEIDDALSWDGTDGAEVNCFIEVRTTPDDPAGSPAWGGWARLDAGEIQARGIQARAQLTTDDSGFTPFVTQLRLYADEVAA